MGRVGCVPEVRSFLAPLIRDPAGSYALLNFRTGAVIDTHLEPSFDSRARNRGLLGRPAYETNKGLVLAPCNAVHMFFMKFPIDVLFVNRDGTIRRISSGLRPWRLAASFGAFATIETAAGVVHQSGTRVGDVLSVEPLTPLN
jgi:uncharacterized membrane protein (UPF0127 family)